MPIRSGRRTEKTIVYRPDKDGGRIFTRAFGVVGEDKSLHQSDTRESPISWSMDGRHIVYESQSALFAVLVLGPQTLIRLTTQATGSKNAGQISPDGASNRIMPLPRSADF